MFSYSIMKNGVLRIAPDFTPYNLTEVIDKPSGYTGTFLTKIPIGEPEPVVLYRKNAAYSSDSNGFNRCFAYNAPISASGYYGVTVEICHNPVRFYIFSKRIPLAPQWGLFLYKNGSMVWHSNCLPLDLKLNGHGVESDYPMATRLGVAARVSLPLNGGLEYLTNDYTSSSAEQSTGKWLIQNWTYRIQYGTQQLGTNSLTNHCYINCEIYDQYYQQVLGV